MRILTHHMKFINTTNAPRAVGAYSQAVGAGGFLFCSGQIPIVPATNELKLFDGDAAGQARLVLSNIKAVLAEASLTLSDVVKTTVFLADMDDFAKVNEVYAAEFGAHKPARACVEVSRLPRDVKVEMDAIACRERS